MDVPDYVPWPHGKEVFRLLRVAGKRYVYSAPPDGFDIATIVDKYLDGGPYDPDAPPGTPCFVLVEYAPDDAELTELLACADVLVDAGLVVMLIDWYSDSVLAVTDQSDVVRLDTRPEGAK
ncbi:MAG TPA: hypothetical protein VNA20_05755 [Frankiaceae bacterium]|nr:hypothetical protein [Frankiaceae bacterium]